MHKFWSFKPHFLWFQSSSLELFVDEAWAIISRTSVQNSTSCKKRCVMTQLATQLTAICHLVSSTISGRLVIIVINYVYRDPFLPFATVLLVHQQWAEPVGHLLCMFSVIFCRCTSLEVSSAVPDDEMSDTRNAAQTMFTQNCTSFSTLFAQFSSHAWQIFVRHVKII